MSIKELRLNKRWNRMCKVKGIRLLIQIQKPQRVELAWKLMQTML